MMQLEQRSEPTPTRHCLFPFTQSEHGRMATSVNSLASSLRLEDGLDERRVRIGGMKDGWFLGTRNLGGGASVRTRTFGQDPWLG